MATTATPWCGDYGIKLYLQSGQFTSTIKTSQDISSIDTYPGGISWDGINTPWCGATDDKLYLQSGQFTSTLKISQYIGDIDVNCSGISADGTNTPWIGYLDNKLYLQSGQFTSTLKTSQSVGSHSGYPKGISWDGENTPWCGYFDTKRLYLTSGQFSSTIITSQYVGDIDWKPSSISWDGTNTPWGGATDIKLYLQSGQFTSTLKTSESLSGIAYPQGISTDDYDGRTGGGPIIKSVSDSLTLTDQVVETIIRVPLNILPTSNTLIFIDEAGYFIGFNRPINTLEFTQTIIVFNNNLRVADVLVFIQIARQPITYNQYVSNTLTFTQSVTYLSNNYIVSDSLYFEQFIDLRGSTYRIDRDAHNTLTLTDESIAFIHFYVFHITDNLNLQQSVITLFPFNLSVIDTLVFDDLLTIQQPYNLSIIEYFDWTYSPDGHPSNPSPGFEQRIDHQLIANRRYHHNLALNQTVQIVKEISGAISKSTNNTLIFTQLAARVYGSISVLTFTQIVNIDLCKSGKNILTFIQLVGHSHKTSYNVSNTLILESTVAYNVITSDILYQYHPFIGDSTVSDAPSPPRQTARTIVKYNNIQLFYPMDNPTETIILRGPEFDDRDQLHFSRINRETRGGTLVVFSDPIWPQNQRLLLSFIGLSETEAQDVLTFVETTVGKQIGLRDWEGKEWAGIILTPDNPITRNHNCNIGLDIEFEGVPVFWDSINQSLDALSDFATIIIYDRPLGSILIFVSTFTHNVDYNRPIIDTLILTPVFDHNVNYGRSIIDTLTPTDDATSERFITKISTDTFTPTDEATSERFITKTSTDTLTLTPVFDHNVDYDRPIIDTLTPTDDAASERFITKTSTDTLTLTPIFDHNIDYGRSETDTLTLSDDIVNIKIMSPIITDTLTLTSTFDHNVDYGRSETDTLTLVSVVTPYHDTPWSGFDADKLYLQSGQFTSTLITSQDVSNIDIKSVGISWNGINTPWSGQNANKLYLQSGQFTSTLKTSQYIGDIDPQIIGISCSRVDTFWAGYYYNKLYLQSGQFTSTLKTSHYVGDIDLKSAGISWDGTNAPWCGYDADKLYLQSGQFTSTLITSQYIGDIDTFPMSISWDSINTPWVGYINKKLYLQSGQFTSTLKISQYIGDIEDEPAGIDVTGFPFRLST